MRIIHVGAHPSPNIVDGINAVIWATAVEQVKLGHQVGLLLTGRPDDAALAISRDTGLELHCVPASTWRYGTEIRTVFIHRSPADIVHFHSVFTPRQATLARLLHRWSIPYVITPHGGLMPQVLERDRLKKAIYSTLIERPRFRRAAGIAFVTPDGERDIRSYIGRFDGPLRWVSNPVDVRTLQQHAWEPAGERARLVFLGRFDVLHKGLDRLAEIARRVPEADFQLYGTEDPDTRSYLDCIRAHRPANLSFHPPVFGAEKLEILRQATMYIQVSRWEALSISILEALTLGIPTVTSQTMSMASMIHDNRLGLVVPAEPRLAAEMVRGTLSDPAQLRLWSECSRAYARILFAPDAVARQVIGVYEEALDCWAKRLGNLVELPQPESDIWRELLSQIEQHQEKDRKPAQLEDLLDRRRHRIGEAVESPAFGNDA